MRAPGASPRNADSVRAVVSLGEASQSVTVFSGFAIGRPRRLCRVSAATRCGARAPSIARLTVQVSARGVEFQKFAAALSCW
jgi:hypothetical protein